MRHEIPGRIIHLDGAETPRSVWLGRDDRAFYVKFVNTEGEETRLRLTEEALQALSSLYSTERAHPAREGGPSILVDIENLERELEASPENHISVPAWRHVERNPTS